MKHKDYIHNELTRLQKCSNKYFPGGFIPLWREEITKEEIPADIFREAISDLIGDKVPWARGLFSYGVTDIIRVCKELKAKETEVKTSPEEPETKREHAMVKKLRKDMEKFFKEKENGN